MPIQANWMNGPEGTLISDQTLANMNYPIPEPSQQKTIFPFGGILYSPEINYNTTGGAVSGLHMWASIDRGKTWNLVDDANVPNPAPVGNFTYSYLVNPKNPAELVFCLASHDPRFVGPFGNGNPFFVQRFNMAQGQWSKVVEGANTPSTILVMKLLIRSDGTFLVAYVPNLSTGSNIFIAESNGVDLTSWTLTDLGANYPGPGTIDPPKLTGVVDSLNIAHYFYADSTGSQTLFYQQWTNHKTLGPFANLGNTAVAPRGPGNCLIFQNQLVMSTYIATGSKLINWVTPLPVNSNNVFTALTVDSGVSLGFNTPQIDTDQSVIVYGVSLVNQNFRPTVDLYFSSDLIHWFHSIVWDWDLDLFPPNVQLPVVATYNVTPNIDPVTQRVFMSWGFVCTINTNIQRAAMAESDILLVSPIVQPGPVANIPMVKTCCLMCEQPTTLQRPNPMVTQKGITYGRGSRSKRT